MAHDPVVAIIDAMTQKMTGDRRAQFRAHRIAALPPMIRLLIPEDDLAGMTNADIAALANVNLAPTRLLANLLLAHNQLREHRALATVV